MRAFIAILIILGTFITVQGQSEVPLASAGATLEEAIQVDLYPNPATDLINIRVADNSTQKLSFEVHNIIGNKIDVVVEELAPGNFQIQIQDLTPGYYLLSVRAEESNKRKVHKFLKR